MEGFCSHYECRCARAWDLAMEAAQKRDDRLLRMALAAHDQMVPCQYVLENARNAAA